MSAAMLLGPFLTHPLHLSGPQILLKTQPVVSPTLRIRGCLDNDLKFCVNPQHDRMKDDRMA